jgi:hypothetical protein
LERNFERSNQLDEDKAKEWVTLVDDAKKGDKEKKKIIEGNNYIEEIKSLCYVPAKWLPGFEPTEEEMLSGFPIPKWKWPLVKAHFLGLQEDPNSQYPKKIGPLNPDWIKYFFKGVFVQLVMLKPNHWCPMVIGNARHAEDDKAPKELLVSKIKIKYLSMNSISVLSAVLPPVFTTTD